MVCVHGVFQWKSMTCTSHTLPTPRIKSFSLLQVCEMKNCTKCIFFEMKKRKDLYMWVSNVPNGPSVKFLVENGKKSSEIKAKRIFLYSAHHG